MAVFSSSKSIQNSNTTKENGENNTHIVIHIYKHARKEGRERTGSNRNDFFSLLFIVALDKSSI
jgi:hypothetical protein